MDEYDYVDPAEHDHDDEEITISPAEMEHVWRLAAGLLHSGSATDLGSALRSILRTYADLRNHGLHWRAGDNSMTAELSADGTMTVTIGIDEYAEPIDGPF